MSGRQRLPRDQNGLTQRQAQVLRLMARGLESGQIAQRMGSSRQAVKVLRVQILEITGCLTSCQAGAWAQRNGYLQSEPRPGATSNTGLISPVDAPAGAEGAGL